MRHDQPTPASWGDAAHPGPRRARSTRRWLDWLTRLFGRLRRSRADDLAMPEPIKMPEGLDIHEPSDTFTIETPALGDAFNFVIRVRCSWCVQATATDVDRERKIAEVREFIELSRTVVQERIEERVRPLARRFAPYRAAEAEELLNQEIVDCLNNGDVRVKVRAWVDVCDPVREDLRKVWRQRLIVDAEGDSKKAYVELLGELQKAWQRLLVTGMEGLGAVQEAKTGWLAPYALALAQDSQNAAGYLKHALVERVEHTEQLLSDLGALVMDDRIEEIEFAFQSDSALRSLLTYLGVPVPSRSTATVGFGGGGDA